MYNPHVELRDGEWAHQFNCRCIDQHCWARSCMWPGVDKGSYTPGLGYTHYYKHPYAVCTQNHLHGCPHPLPEPDPENARCCYAPTYKGRGKTMSCQVCGAKAPRYAAKDLNQLPHQPGVPCRHENRRPSIVGGWTECPDCRDRVRETGGASAWDCPPDEVRPFQEPTRTFDEVLEELSRRLST